jgi:hypothetical protein
MFQRATALTQYKCKNKFLIYQIYYQFFTLFFKIFLTENQRIMKINFVSYRKIIKILIFCILKGSKGKSFPFFRLKTPPRPELIL